MDQTERCGDVSKVGGIKGSAVRMGDTRAVGGNGGVWEVMGEVMEGWVQHGAAI